MSPWKWEGRRSKLKLKLLLPDNLVKSSPTFGNALALVTHGHKMFQEFYLVNLFPHCAALPCRFHHLCILEQIIDN